MHYRSISDMADTIVGNLHRLPRDIDLVVGVPRSGILAANLFCLLTNIPMTDLDGFLAGRVYTSGVSPKRRAALDRNLTEMRRILILDDSVRSGQAMALVRGRLAAAGIGGNVMLGAIYGAQAEHSQIDFIFEVVPTPRVFQWNLMHHVVLERACVDIDGVLCLDPTREQNDDGPAYRKFLAEAVPLHRPTRRISALVTSRLEKYRSLTEDWMARHGIEYDELIMLDLPSAEERRRLGVHGSFKGGVYRDRPQSKFFIESEPAQAEAIARISGKPALCIETNQLFQSDELSVAALRQRMRNMPVRLKQTGGARVAGGIKGTVRLMLGESGWKRLKAIVRPKPVK